MNKNLVEEFCGGDWIEAQIIDEHLINDFYCEINNKDMIKNHCGCSYILKEIISFTDRWYRVNERCEYHIDEWLKRLQKHRITNQIIDGGGNAMWRMLYG